MVKFIGFNRITQFAVLIPAVAAAFLLPFGPASAQGFFTESGNLVTAEPLASISLFHPGSTAYIAVRATIRDQWHINSDSPLDRFLIPTVLEMNLPDGIESAGIFYPEADLQKLEFSDSKMSLFHGTIIIGTAVKIGKDVEPGEYDISIVFRYQGCNNITCLEPASIIVPAKIRVGNMNETSEALHPEIFSAPPFIDDKGNPVAAGSDRGENGSFSNTFSEKGLFLAFILIFLGGLALNLTPCIYPLIPITISYFGGQAGGKASRAFLLALIYVFGMSITYSILGMIAAMTGSLFGSALQNPVIVLFIAAVLIGLSTSMFGLWEFRLPMFLTRRTGTARQGYWGALFMGLTVGIVAAPCIGPFVLGLLTYVGEMGRPVLGFFMFFTLAWGMGIPFIALGTASGSLPASGNWMIWIKKVFAFILLIMAVYFARTLLGNTMTYLLYAILAAIAGLFLGWIARVPGMGKSFLTIRRILGSLWLLAAIIVLAIPGGPFREETLRPGIVWQPFTMELFEDALSKRMPVMIDFSADWCIPCHELEHNTFNAPGVLEKSKSFVPLKVDLTKSGETEDSFKKKFSIKGVPTIIFYDKTGKEPEGSRITGYVSPGIMLEKMSAALGGQDKMEE
ncbi:MAG: thioredoxin fold domain-containing protein [Candidatus Krumholzibacteriota bacterium]|nr:thioredoxin fold domain-containing protein [Candidatus Krumholzibacteriota bacterium]